MAVATANMGDSRSPTPDFLTNRHSRSPCDVSLFDSFNEEFSFAAGSERRHDDSPKILNDDDMDDSGVRLFCQLLGIYYDLTPASDTDEDIESYFEFLSLMYHKWSTVNMNTTSKLGMALILCSVICLIVLNK